MKKENQIKEQLLNQTQEGATTNNDLAQRILAKNAKSVKRLKQITIASWLLVVLLFLAAILIEFFSGRNDLPQNMSQALGQIIAPTVKIMLRAFLTVSVFLAIALYVRSRTLCIKQINARLANIEKQLEKITKVNQERL